MSEGTQSAHNQLQKRYFEGAIKRTMVPRATRYVARHVDEALRAGAFRKGDRVLELGCGMGRFTFALAECGARVEGLDLSSVLLDRLQSFNVNRVDIPLHCADIAEAGPSLEGSFDLAVGFFVLHHLHDLDKSFAGVTRTLKRGGRAVFVEPNPWNPLFYVQMAFTQGMTWEGDRGIIRMRRNVIFGAMKTAGLVNLVSERFGFFPPFLANSNLGARLETSLEKVFIWRSLLPFQIFRGEKP